MIPMLRTIMSSLFSKSATIEYPKKNREVSPIAKGIIEIDTSTCNHCTLCMLKCPTGAIKVSKEDKIWSINRFDCIQCYHCVESCNKNSLSMSTKRPEAGYTKEIVTVKSDVSETKE